jgi:hypothetical protein
VRAGAPSLAADLRSLLRDLVRPPCLVALALLAVAYVGVLWRVELVHFVDSGGYTDLRARAFLSDAWWGTLLSGKPFTVPLLYYWVSDAGTEWLQLGVGFASLVFLAGSTALLIENRRLRLATFFVLVLFGFGRDLIIWHKAVFAESLSLSFAFLWLGALFLVLRTPGWTTALLYVVVALGFAFCRDSNPFVLIVSAPVLLLARTLWRRPAVLGIVLAAEVAIVGAAGHFAFQNRRHVMPLVGWIGLHVLPDPDARAFFVAHGMPLNQKVLSYEGKQPYLGLGWDGFQPWLDEHGRETFLAWLLANPGMTLGRPLRDCPPAFDYGFAKHLQDPTAPSALYPVLARLSTYSRWTLPLVVLAGLVLVVLNRTVVGPPFAFAALWIAATGMSNVFASYWGDEGDVPRHILVANVILTLGVTVFVLRQLDWWLRRRAAREPG